MMSSDSIVVFLGLSVVTLATWYFLAHISTYFEYKGKYIKPEHLKEFTFLKYTASEIKRYFTGKGQF